jgi:flavin-binding protein dodecin
MSEHVYRKLEIVGSSKIGIEDAIRNALAEAAKTASNLRWFEVIETRGYIDKSAVAYYQVTLKIGHTTD